MHFMMEMLQCSQSWTNLPTEEQYIKTLVKFMRMNKTTIAICSAIQGLVAIQLSDGPWHPVLTKKEEGSLNYFFEKK